MENFHLKNKQEKQQCNAKKYTAYLMNVSLNPPTLRVKVNKTLTLGQRGDNYICFYLNYQIHLN